MVTKNFYLKTNSLAGKNFFSFLFQFTHDLRTSQHFCGGEASVFSSYLLIVNFLFQFLTVNFQRNCFCPCFISEGPG